MNPLINIIVVCGPTGIGKTSFAIKLAQKYNGEIISADSMQIYRQMNIGTAKPTPEEKTSVHHHMVDIVDPDQAFDAVMFYQMADRQIEKIVEKKRVPFVVGGTGFYIKALLHGLFSSEKPDLKFREDLKAKENHKGTGFLHEELGKLDPEAAKKIHPNDSYRIVRALETIKTTGKTLSQYHQDHGFSETRYNALKIGLHMERKALYDRINRRVDVMIQEGLLEEVKLLLRNGYTEGLKSMQSLGYRHMLDFLHGRVTWEEAVRTMKRDTRRYAKRQLTWFKADKEVLWVEPDKIDHVYALVDNHFERFPGQWT